MFTTFKMDALIALFSGIALVFAFSPTHIIWLAILAPAALYGVLNKHKPWRATQLGFIFGFGFFATGVSWVFVSIYYFGGTSFWISLLLTLFFVCVLACLFALLGFTLQKFFPTHHVSKILLVYPALWVLCEALRSWLFTGFPWLLLGQSTVNSVFAGLPPIFGAYGTSYWLVLISGLFFMASVPEYRHSTPHSARLANLSLLSLVILFAGVYGLSTIHWSNALKQPLHVSLVQGNIPQNLRWDTEQVHHILSTYQSLSEGHNHSDLIVWPEGAIPLATYQVSQFLQQLNMELTKTHGALITGIPYATPNNVYNAVISLGDAQGFYFKRHLVPFGEYVPFEKKLRGIIRFFDLPMSNFSEGLLHQSLITIHHIPLGIYLCYEVAYSQVIRADLPKAAVLVTLSDDAWFGRSLAPWQHLQIGQFAALETGRPMLFVGNDGITAIINAQGQLQSLLPQHTANVLDGTVTPYVGLTPWVRIGDRPYLLIMLIGLVLCYRRAKK